MATVGLLLRRVITLTRFLGIWLVTALSLLLTAALIPGMQLDGVTAAAIAAIILGLVNALVRPLLVLFTLPLTILTLGLFLLVVNALSLSIVAYFTPGFELGSFWDALFGSLILSFISGLLNQFFGLKD
jgi:putative membrane protein